MLINLWNLNPYPVEITAGDLLSMMGMIQHHHTLNDIDAMVRINLKGLAPISILYSRSPGFIIISLDGGEVSEVKLDLIDGQLFLKNGISLPNDAIFNMTRQECSISNIQPDDAVLIGLSHPELQIKE